MRPFGNPHLSKCQTEMMNLIKYVMFFLFTWISSIKYLYLLKILIYLRCKTTQIINYRLKCKIFYLIFNLDKLKP